MPLYFVEKCFIFNTFPNVFLGLVYENVDPMSLVRLEDLGTGTCGHVVKMRHLPSGRVMAVKQMRKSGVPEENRRIYMDLDVVLRCTDCPHIVHCYGYFVTDSEVRDINLKL